MTTTTFEPTPEQKKQMADKINEINKILNDANLNEVQKISILKLMLKHYERLYGIESIMV